MLQKRKINKDVCAVAFEPTEIMLRKCGKEHFGAEKPLAVIKDGKLYVFADVAKEFGIEICQSETQNL